MQKITPTRKFFFALARIKLALALIFGTLSFISTSKAQSPSVVIGGKAFTEQHILGEIIAQALEAYSLPVKRQFFLGDTLVTFSALKEGKIHIYPEYTGTAYSFILKHQKPLAKKEVFKIVKKELFEKFDIHTLPSFGFNNTYAIAVNKNDKKLSNYKTISELKPIAHSLTLGIDPASRQRPLDGLKPFTKAYNLNLKGSVSLNSGLLYKSLAENKVDMIYAYSTDGRIQSLNLRLLEDDLDFFPPYEAIPLIQGQIIKHYPEITKILKPLLGKISDSKMAHLNYLVDFKHIPAAQVAKDFLSQKATSEKNKIPGFFFWQGRYELLYLTYQHLLMTLVALLLATVMAIPLGILASKHRVFEQVIFTFINFCQTIPSLALFGLLIPLLGIGFKPAVVTLFLYGLLPIVRTTHAGILEINPHLIEVTQALGMNRWERLRLIELPLTMPFIFAGLRTSAVIMVGTATIAAFIGAGGLGEPIFQGIASLNSERILFGAIPAAFLAIFIDKIFGIMETKLFPKVHLSRHK